MGNKICFHFVLRRKCRHEVTVLKILITGGAGFIGSHLAGHFLSSGDEVTVLDNLSTGRLENVEIFSQNPRYFFVKGDVCDAAVISPLIKNCDMIYHLAAAVGVQLIVEQPVHTITTNIFGTETVLKAAAEFDKKLMLASTSEVYGKNSKIPFSEEDDTTLGCTRLNRWSYACSKMIDEFLALAYHEKYSLPVVICRFFNTIGPRQTGRYGMVVPRFVRSALAGRPIEIYGTGRQSRCFCNVSDIIRAMTSLMACPEAYGRVINVGSRELITIIDLAKKVIELTGSASEIKYLTYEQAYGRAFDDMQTRMPDLSRIGELIGYSPQKNLDETLQEIIAFEKEQC